MATLSTSRDASADHGAWPRNAAKRGWLGRDHDKADFCLDLGIASHLKDVATDPDPGQVAGGLIAAGADVDHLQAGLRPRSNQISIIAQY